jgi:hypothetical protein
MSGILSAYVGGSYGAKPGAPTIGTATATGLTTATVSYTAPAFNGGVPITSYTATSSPGGITGTLSTAGSGTITVSGLTTGTAYTFTVTATNSIGTSAPSAASNSITTYSVPVNTVAPAVTGTATFGQTLSTTTGTWTGNPASFSYAYQWQRSGSNIGSANSSTYTLVQADVGNTIRCVVTATNSGGSTAANSNSTATVAATVPGAPTSVTASATGSSTASVSWTAPASNGGANITQYNISWTGGSTTSATTSASITGLTASTSYTFTVTATNSAGTGSGGVSNSITTSAVSSYVSVPQTQGPTSTLGFWRWTSSGFSSQTANFGSTFYYNANFNNASNQIVCSDTTNSTGSWVAAYPWNNNTGTYGSRYSSPASTPSTSFLNMAFNPAATIAAGCAAGRSYDLEMRAWNFSSSGWGSYIGGVTNVYETTVSLSSFGIFYSKVDRNVFTGVLNSTTPMGRLLSSGGFGTEFTAPSSFNGNPFGASPGSPVVINQAGTRAIYTTSASQSLNAYPISTSGFGTLISMPSATGISYPFSTSMNYNDTLIACGGYAGAQVVAIAWSNSSGYGSTYSAPGTAVSGQPGSVALTGTGFTVSVDASPWLQGYYFSGGFGTLYSAPGAAGTNQSGFMLQSNTAAGRT